MVALLTAVRKKLAGSVGIRGLMALLAYQARRCLPRESMAISRLQVAAPKRLHPMFEEVRDKASVPRLAFIGSSTEPDARYFCAAAEALGIQFEILDPLASNFMAKFDRSGADLFLVRPMTYSSLEREIYEEIYDYLGSGLSRKVLPLPQEMKIYESKRRQFYLLRAKNISRPTTFLEFSEASAMRRAEELGFPVIFKSSLGSGGSSVQILTSAAQARRHFRRLFRGKYYSSSLYDPRDFDYGYALIQKFYEDVREYRVIKIGESWFGHEKLAGSNGILLSGSGKNSWNVPGMELFDFCREIAEDNGFRWMAFDVLVDREGNHYLNELQTWFGSVKDSQMYLEGVPGRYVFRDGNFVFEKGEFNVLGGMCLRIADAVAWWENGGALDGQELENAL